MFGRVSRFIDPHVEQYLLVAEDEQIVDEVRRHPASIVWPAVRLVLAALLFFGALLVDPNVSLILILISFGVALEALWRMLAQHMDRFVITNMRVFRIRGVFSRTLATMPMTRILDITVEKPPLGRLLGFGHFVFESAAQDQGLRDIRYVGRPDERDLIIQRLIQQSGLRTGPKPS